MGGSQLQELQLPEEPALPSSPLSLCEVEIDSLNSTAVHEYLACSEKLEEGTEPTDDPIYQAYRNSELTSPCKAAGQEGAEPATAGVSKRSCHNVEGFALSGSKPKKAKVESTQSPANARRRFRREVEAEIARTMRAKLDVKYKQSATPLETDLDSDKLETTSSSYEAKKEGATMPSRDTFSFSFRGPDLQSNGHEGTEKAKQTKSTPNATPPSRDPASLKNISNPHVRTILDKMMKEDGFAYKAWDGGTSHPVLDSLKRVAVVLVGKINQESYQNATKEVFEGMEACGASAYFSDSESKHKRGKFPAVNVGISLGPGGTKPMRVSVGGHGPMMQRLIDNKHVQRLASHQDASFKFWQPKLYKHYSDMMVKLRGRNPTLRKNFPRSVFASMAFNFPPHVYTHRHRDVRNLPYGMCAVHALGNFDPTAGGHLILWELKLIIEFPPGCMVLLPSATITHSNVPVAVGQKRASITQYTAGSLFRHVDNGFTTDAALKASNKARFEVHSAARLCRWEKGLNMWSKYVDGKII